MKNVADVKISTRPNIATVIIIIIIIDVIMSLIITMLKEQYVVLGKRNINWLDFLSLDKLHKLSLFSRLNETDLKGQHCFILL